MVQSINMWGHCFIVLHAAILILTFQILGYRGKGISKSRNVVAECSKLALEAEFTHCQR